MENLKQKFLTIKVHQSSGEPALHKILLVLYAIGQAISNNRRMLPFVEIDKALLDLFNKYYPQASSNKNTHYPFGKLENDGIWEIEYSKDLKRTAAGHLYKNELLEANIAGGFIEPIYNDLVLNKSVALDIAEEIAKKYFSSEDVPKILRDLCLYQHANLHDELIETNNNPSGYIKEANIDIVATTALNQKNTIQAAVKQNQFISYLNSLHNINASGANALAESQATNPFFGEIYQPFPIAKNIVDLLQKNAELVIVLTGHAGDGKSTVALDVFKTIQGISVNTPLTEPFKEKENIGKNINIVKDMSELSAEQRSEWLEQAFSENGSWLIISNTGPLLQSLVDYAEKVNIQDDIENQLLAILDQPLSKTTLEKNSIDLFSKKLLILNLTRIDNVELGSKVLTRLIKHSAWDNCTGCKHKSVCPIQRNRNALIESGSVAEERVRWIYHRLHAYEQRLTLRQIVAHLAFSITGNTDCSDVHQHTLPNQTQEDQQSHQALGKIIFSETFFGFQAGKPYEPAERLRAIALIRRSTFGAPVGVDFERKLSREPGLGWGTLPSTLIPLSEKWQRQAAESAGVRWRFGLRRMNYLFAKINNGRQESAHIFLDTFLQSPQLRNFDQWQLSANHTLSSIQARHLRSICLRVLLEIFSGFSAQQFNKSGNNNLYITLRRPNQEVVQPTQVIVCTIPFKSFAVDFDAQKFIPVLSYEKGKAVLPLSLPLLDYIYNRHDGNLGSELSRIHQTQLAAFRADLVKVSKIDEDHNAEIDLLRMGINGEAQVHSFFIDEATNTLEKLEY